VASLVCRTCGTGVDISEPVPRDSTCEKCGHDLRCCRNCRHWDPRYHNQCTETEAEPVADRERRNFCEYFYFSRAPFVAGAAGPDRAAEARAKLDALFRKPPPAENE
jgi:hypothetical protein